MRVLVLRLTGIFALLGLLAVPSAVLAQPDLSVVPPAGPIGTRFDFFGSGFAGPASVVVVVRDPTGREDRGGPPGSVGASGVLRANSSWDSAPGEPLGVYTVIIETLDGAILATATFMVTGTGTAGAPAASPTVPSQSSPVASPTGTGGNVPAAPPAAGAGGLAQQESAPWVLLAGLATVCLAGLAYRGATRRHSG